ncbi:MAG: DNA polymerase subunit beta [Candidatus Korarchaeota archaeon]|nr:DNA polymerase subunit beta [Thermoproteota archaeon]MCR8454893.1 DNA polymerase subunit beta [Thermoproteota archaeon]MCR8472745.1 DNA polymerase subunit beta [Thermoproteota archaeon]MCR8487760.1 DNA polymerase subunit beta [Thermoproteota archaeon]
MPKTHAMRNTEITEIMYSEEHWKLLRSKRDKGVSILTFLSHHGLNPFIFGSVARGDVHKDSDVEIVVTNHKALSQIELLLLNNFNLEEKIIVMATPRSAPKVYFNINLEVTVAVPAVPLNKSEYEFYSFGGKIQLPEAADFRKRVPGVNKKLCLVLPTRYGHKEYSIIGRESEVARILGISIQTVIERETMLLRRRRAGRAGVFLKVYLEPYESTEKELAKLQDSNPAVRRLLRERGI